MKKIPLSKGLFALVSDEDFEFAMQWKWSASDQSHNLAGLYYAIRRPSLNGKRVKVWLHLEIAKRMWGEIPEGYVPHHTEHTLDCQREHLQKITKEENAHLARSKGWYNRNCQQDEPCL